MLNSYLDPIIISFIYTWTSGPPYNIFSDSNDGQSHSFGWIQIFSNKFKCPRSDLAGHSHERVRTYEIDLEIVSGRSPAPWPKIAKSGKCLEKVYPIYSVPFTRNTILILTLYTIRGVIWNASILIDHVLIFWNAPLEKNAITWQNHLSHTFWGISYYPAYCI